MALQPCQSCYACGRSLSLRELIKSVPLCIRLHPFDGQEYVNLKELEIALKRESQGAKANFETTSLLSTQKYSRLPPDEWRSVLNREGVVIYVDPENGTELVDAEQFTMAFKRLHASEKIEPKRQPHPEPGHKCDVLCSAPPCTEY